MHCFCFNFYWNAVDLGFPDGSVVKTPPANTGDAQVQSLGPEDPLEKEMGIHSSMLAWEIPWTEEPGWATYSPWGWKLSDSTTTNQSRLMIT